MCSSIVRAKDLMHYLRPRHVPYIFHRTTLHGKLNLRWSPCYIAVTLSKVSCQKFLRKIRFCLRRTLNGRDPRRPTPSKYLDVGYVFFVDLAVVLPFRSMSVCDL
jgi:hypothetical protein